MVPRRCGQDAQLPAPPSAGAERCCVGVNGRCVVKPGHANRAVLCDSEGIVFRHSSISCVCPTESDPGQCRLMMSLFPGRFVA